MNRPLANPIYLLAFSEQLPFTALLNKLFGHQAAQLAGAFGVHADAHAPIPNWIAMQIFVVLALIAFFTLARTRLSVESPGGIQHTVEGIHGFISGLGKELIGHGYEPFVPYLLSLGMFILTMNLIGLVPGFESPTANPAVPLGCAVVTFIYYHYQGIRHQGAHYIHQFIGPVIFLAPLMFVIEVVSHTARVLSLTVRLFANIFAGDMLTLAFFSLIPIGVPVVFLALHLGVSLIQTYIFVLLATVYLAGAISEEH